MSLGDNWEHDLGLKLLVFEPDIKQSPAANRSELDDVLARWATPALGALRELTDRDYTFMAA